jgi:hypothetical protein
MALVAVAMVGIIAMAGLSIDVGTLYEASAETQRAADAGALAAARTLSMQGLTGNPGNTGGTDWTTLCGGPASLASQTATTVVSQSPISGASSNPVVTVTYSYTNGASSTDCTGMVSTAFAVNPLVTVVVQQGGLPTYFSRIWGRTGNTVSGTATAEAFNPSNSATYAGAMVPVQPRCVKPWIVPNADPQHPPGCTGVACAQFVSPSTGQITTPGTFVNAGVIGERFFLQPDCTAAGGATCNLTAIIGGGTPTSYNPPTAVPPVLLYVPGQASFSSIAVPTNGATCGDVTSNFAKAIAGCDQSTVYRCGVPLANVVDLSENPLFPPPGDTQNAVQCLIHQTSPFAASPSGQDVLAPGGPPPPTYPFQIQAGTSSPLLATGLASDSNITSSSSIVTLPIYDTATLTAGITQVTIVGFLQVFINAVDATNGMNVTVLNVSGCTNSVTGGPSALPGTSPVPVRLITSP